MSTGTIINAIAIGTILNHPEDADQVTTLSVADASATEGEGATLDFEVTLEQASTTTVTVDYMTNDGTAEAGSDYTTTNGSVSFAVGETSKTVSVPVVNDADVEESETMTLTLFDSSGSDIEDDTATGTIADDDEADKEPEAVGSNLSVAAASTTEADGAALGFTVTLSPAASATVTVSYGTGNGSAQAGSDYTATSGTLSFSAGQTSKTISVPVANDNENESSETLTLSAASGAEITDATATGTIPQPRGARARPADSQLLRSAERARRLGLHVHARVQRAREGELRDAARQRLQRGRRPHHQGQAEPGRQQPELDDERRAGRHGTVSIQLPETTSCSASNAICTHAGQPLSNSPSASVRGPVGISVADARVDEGDGAQTELRGVAQPERQREPERRLRDERRHRARGKRLHRRERHRQLQRRGIVGDDHRGRAERHARRGQRDDDAHAVESVGRSAQRRERDRNDRQPRPDAEGAPGAVRPHGGRPHRGRGGVDGIELVAYQTRTPEGMRRVEQMVRVRDYDAREDRWVVDAVWPPAALTKKEERDERATAARMERSRRLKGGAPPQRSTVSLALGGRGLTWIGGTGTASCRAVTARGA